MSYGPILTIFLSIVAIGSILFLSTHSAFDAHLLLQAQGNKIHDKPSPSDFKRNNQISKSTDQDIDEKVNIKIKDSKSQKKAKNAEHVISSSSTTSSSSSSSSSSQCKLKARKSSCDISPRLLPYWSDEPDCFTSPLRRSSTHASDVDKRKYVVMQPDLGGWNNIRMALELGLLFAHVTGRIFVLPPPAVLYLLHQNKKWKDNYSTFADFLDFKRLGQGDGLKTIQMRDFLEEVALPGLLSKPLPNNDIDMKKQPLWDYLESACYTRQWSPGKTFIVFNITEGTYQGHVSLSDSLDYSILNASKRFQEFHLGREPVLYDDEFDSQRVVYFAGHEENRILMHFYGYLYFTNDADDRVAKRFARDRMRYVDEVYCSAGEVIDQLALLTRSGSMTSHTHRRILSESKHHFSSDKKGNNNVHKHDNNKAHSGSYKSSHHSKPKSKTKNKGESKAVAIKTNSGKTDVHNPTAIEARALQNRYGTGNRYIAYHIRRGDFQHKHTQIDANTILNSTRYLLPVNRDSYMIYISTDEKNRR